MDRSTRDRSEVVSSNFGIIYCATSDFHAKLARYSITSLRALEPQIPVVIFVSKEVRSSFANTSVEVRVIEEPDFSYNDKITAIINSPFELTLYVDADTVFLRPISNSFQKLSRFCDVAVRGGMSFNLSWEPDLLPEAIAQFNTGVILLNKEAKEYIAPRWLSLREQFPESHDQPTFRMAVLESEFRLAELSPDFNFMPRDVVLHEVKIAHFASVRSMFQIRVARLNTKFLTSAAPGTRTIFWGPCRFRDLIRWRLYASVLCYWHIKLKQTMFPLYAKMRKRLAN